MKITNKGKLASVKGFANERRLVAALLERGYNASIVDLPHSTYDIVVEGPNKNNIRLQVKTVDAKECVKFVGGVRGGVDRQYKSDEKEYTQNKDTSDAVVGVKSTQSNGDKQIDYWIIPTCYIEKIGQKSLSTSKIPNAKNNWALMEKCKDLGYVLSVLGTI